VRRGHGPPRSGYQAPPPVDRPWDEHESLRGRYTAGPRIWEISGPSGASQQQRADTKHDVPGPGPHESPANGAGTSRDYYHDRRIGDKAQEGWFLPIWYLVSVGTSRAQAAFHRG